MPPEFPVSFPKAGRYTPAGPDIPPSTQKTAFTNPFSRDASGRNAFERGGDILRDTFRGSVADVKTAGGLLPGETGATGEKTRTGAGVGFDVKSIVVYAVAAVIAVFGFLMISRGPAVTIERLKG